LRLAEARALHAELRAHQYPAEHDEGA
jgi:hypothetical protein